MDGLKLQAKVYKGYGQAAKRIGRAFDVYRWNPNGIPVLKVAQNRVNPAMQAQFVLGGSNAAFMRGAKPSDAQYVALVDGRTLQPGDVFFGPGGPYFIQSMMPLLPIVAVRCNATLQIYRPKAINQAQVGNLGYLARREMPVPEVTEETLWAEVPAALKVESSGRGVGAGHLPGDSPGPTKWVAHLPPYVAKGSIEDRDFVRDDTGARYQISAALWANDAYVIEMAAQQL